MNPPNPKALTYLFSWVFAALAAIITHNYPWMPNLSPDVQEILATLAAWALSNFLIGHHLNPLNLISRSKAKKEIKEIATGRK